jgi:hypothetical protein
LSESSCWRKRKSSISFRSMLFWYISVWDAWSKAVRKFAKVNYNAQRINMLLPIFVLASLCFRKIVSNPTLLFHDHNIVFSLYYSQSNIIHPLVHFWLRHSAILSISCSMLSGWYPGKWTVDMVMFSLHAHIHAVLDCYV